MRKIIFVGSFKESSASGHVGGQMFVCNSLVNSKITERFDFLKIDSTAPTNEARGLIDRALPAMKRLLRFLLLILKYKPDGCLVFSGDGLSFVEKGLMIIIARAFGKPAAWSPRNGRLMHQLMDWRYKWYFYFVKRSLHTIVCQGTIWKDYFINQHQMSPDKCVVIENFIDTKIYQAKITPNAQSDSLRILFLAWVQRNKGIIELCEAARKLIPDYPFLKFIIAGGGSDTNIVHAYVTQYRLQENFEFKGWVYGNEKIKLIQSCDVFLLPSYSEGFPNALLECLACGLIPVVTKVGAIPDVMNRDVSGYLIQPKSSIEIVAALRSIISNREIIYGMKLQNAKAAKEHFDIEKGIEKYMACLENLCSTVY